MLYKDRRDIYDLPRSIFSIFIMSDSHMQHCAIRELNHPNGCRPVVSRPRLPGLSSPPRPRPLCFDVPVVWRTFCSSARVQILILGFNSCWLFNLPAKIQTRWRPAAFALNEHY